MEFDERVVSEFEIIGDMMSIDVSKVKDGCREWVIRGVKMNSNVGIREKIMSKGKLISIRLRWSYGRSKGEWVSEMK